MVDKQLKNNFKMCEKWLENGVGNAPKILLF